ncbi:MAG: cardiolipin synthase [Clostridia bacterium]|nr:cardiolipin synthase [Clostridia bacterium]
MKKFFQLIFSRMTFVTLFLGLQILAIVWVLTYFRSRFADFYSIFIIISVVVVIYILNQDDNPAYKIAWIIPIMVFPIFGTPLYFLFGKSTLPKALRTRMSNIQSKYEEAYFTVASRWESLEKLDLNAALQSRYMETAARSPVFTHTETEYFGLGDTMFVKMLEEMNRAEKFIFLEYFIIAPGKMWDEILAVLEEKVAAGVDVRVIYDDMGSIMTLPKSYYKKLQAKGIKCQVFHRFQPILNGSFNNRDHRKICVVDGNVAFTGGINLADEYINAIERFGHWLDCGVMVRGDAAYGFTVMFLSMWDYINRTNDEFTLYLPDRDAIADVTDDGFVQPYTDTPTDDEAVGEIVYLNMINRAKKYISISTPYLVIDNEMLTALTTAAKCGVDVRIITPGIPDKWYVFAVTRSYYGSLLQAGVRIYEYAPGFIHSKICVCDDEYGICGSINFDYRSLYLHHECAAWMYRSKAVIQMRDDFNKTLLKCREITPEMWSKQSWHKRLLQSLLRVFAPMM